MFTEPHTDHEVKCKIGHKWLRNSHLASAPAVLIQVGHYTVVWYRHRQVTAYIRQLGYVLAKTELSCSRPGLPGRHSLSNVLVLRETKIGLLVISLLNVIHSPLFPSLRVGEKLFSRHHTQHNIRTNSNSTNLLLRETVDHKMKIKAAKRRCLRPLEFYQFHLNPKPVSLTSTITFLEKDTLTANPNWRSRAFTWETIITQNIEEGEGETAFWCGFTLRLLTKRAEEKNWFHDAKVARSVLGLTESGQ